ncbi:MAG TPA: AraC family transcriptional regulator [Thermoanaerobaculia bacterium]|nr:AraC family transcriptional regulator [Thermoanaerobaculia bacterium]
MSDHEDFERRIFSYYPPLQRVREYVEQNLSEPISLREAASAAGLEEKYFSAFFHRKTGVCFRDWLAGRRVGRAIEILTQHDDTITNVAASVGFQDLGTFERSFKRLTGLTPREFKRSVAPEALEVIAQAAPAIPVPPPAVEAAEPLPEGNEMVEAEALPLYAAARPRALMRGLGLRDLVPLPAGSFLMATPAVARAPSPVPP